MPRTRRTHLPNTLVHVIVRFSDERFLLTDDVIRRNYLRRLDHALARSDWRLAAYALMSSHVHLVMRTGERDLDSWARRLHSGFIGWWHERRRESGTASRGPLIADRPTTVFFEEADASNVVAYVHNNPVRAGVVEAAHESTWTSHRTVVGLEVPVCRHLDVRMTLRLCGFEVSAKGRLAFDADVRSRLGEALEPRLTDREVASVRANVRRAFGTGVEVAPGRAGRVVPAPNAHSHVRRGYGGSPEDVLMLVAVHLGVPLVELRSRRRGHARAGARKVAILVWAALDRPMSEMAASLAVSRSYASRVIAEVDEQLAAAVRQVLERIAAELEAA